MVEDDIVYTPVAGYCGMDIFSYTLTDVTGENSDSAIVTIFVICQPTTMPTYFSGDDLIGVPPNFGQDTPSIDRSEPTAAPSEFSGDDSLGVPPNFSEGTADCFLEMMPLVFLQTLTKEQLIDPLPTLYSFLEMMLLAFPPTSMKALQIDQHPSPHCFLEMMLLVFHQTSMKTSQLQRDPNSKTTLPQQTKVFLSSSLSLIMTTFQQIQQVLWEIQSMVM